DAASRALMLGEDHLEERPVFLAARAHVMALLQLGDKGRLPEAARRCLEIGTLQGAPELDELRAALIELAEIKSRAAGEEDVTVDPLEAEFAEANRLARLGDVDGVVGLADRLNRSQRLTKQQLGWLEGIRAHALQNAQRDRE